MNIAKLKNPILVFDLEATSSIAADGIQENNDIIQIGAVMLNTRLEVIDEFNALVKPQEQITEFITDLTGISNKDVEDKPYFDEVALEFEEWAKRSLPNGNLKKLRIAAWGNYFDINLLRRDYRRYARRYPFAGTAIDVKTLAMFWLSMRGCSWDTTSVGGIAKIMGIELGGEAHNALVDAHAEANILQRVFADFDSGAFVLDKKNRHHHLQLSIARSF